MAKKKEVNKSEAIRNALKASPGQSPSEIAAKLQGKGIKVNAQYVSVVKSSMKSKGAKMAGKTVRKTGGQNGSPLSAALEFIRAAGGLDKAKETLGTIEEISRTVR